MSGVLVGCPVAHREWIIRHWADAVLVACARAGLEPTFVVAAHVDDPTPGVLRNHLDRPVCVVATAVDRRADRRDWQPARYVQMASIRNQLLSAVRDLHPDLFLSLDSDILLHPDALTAMMELLDRFDAAGSACFLSRPPRRRGDGVIGNPSWLNPNYAMLTRDERLDRTWQPDAMIQVDVIMAIKLMTPAAYQVDYRPHRQGEDAGWGLACRDAQVHLGWTSTTVSKHVMESRCAHHPDHDPTCAACLEPIDRPDPRCGY